MGGSYCYKIATSRKEEGLVGGSDGNMRRRWWWWLRGSTAQPLKQ
ncbi:MAG: hypothetical protein ACMUJM_04385 [bacterium]